MGRVENRRDVVPFYLCPLIADMSSDVMRYSAHSYLVIYRATRSLGLVKRLRCSSVFKGHVNPKIHVFLILCKKWRIKRI